LPIVEPSFVAELDEAQAPEARASRTMQTVRFMARRLAQAVAGP